MASAAKPSNGAGWHDPLDRFAALAMTGNSTGGRVTPRLRGRDRVYILTPQYLTIVAAITLAARTVEAIDTLSSGACALAPAGP
jgi:hypothetical protein